MEIEQSPKSHEGHGHEQGGPPDGNVPADREGHEAEQGFVPTLLLGGALVA